MVSRHSFLAGLAATCAAPALLAAVPRSLADSGIVRLSLGRDSETIDVVLARFIDGHWLLDEEGYAKCNYLLRDKVAGVVEPMSIPLLVLLADIQWRADGARILITSGLRIPSTNAATEGAARNSRHMHHDAADIVMEGLSMPRLFALAATSRYCGGLGLYDSHVHVDTWLVRTWEL